MLDSDGVVSLFSLVPLTHRPPMAAHTTPPNPLRVPVRVRFISSRTQRLGATVAGLGVLLALLPQTARYFLLCMLARPLVGTSGVLNTSQWVDGHPYAFALTNPPSEIAKVLTEA